MRAFAGDVPLTGFSAVDLFDLCGRDHRALTACAARLRNDGLEAVAECPVDRLDATTAMVDVVRALTDGGLGVWRLTVDSAPLDRRLDLAERAAAIHDATGGVRAFAPLPRLDSADVPSTGYDDVRTIAVARLVCRDIPSIQVDWPLYGPKLAQVALVYGANDIDGIAVADTPGLGLRRSPVEDIARQIRAAAGVPVERNGRYERRP
jgi:aminodeoxyfutalosine synthase